MASYRMMMALSHYPLLSSVYKLAPLVIKRCLAIRVH
jgi:hypothetical protein